MTTMQRISVLLWIVTFSALIWFFIYRAREKARGRAAFWEWRKTTDSTTWRPEEGFFPMALLEGNNVFFQYGVIDAVHEERRILLEQLLDDEEDEDY